MITAKSLLGKMIEARDGPAGQLKDLYFDERQWRICYLAVSTGKWLPPHTAIILSDVVTDSWHGASGVSIAMTKQQIRAGSNQNAQPTGGRISAPHLRSIHDVLGYHLQATDGQAGHVEDFVIDDEHNSIRFIVIDTEKYFTRRKVLIPACCIDRIDGAGRLVLAELCRHAVASSPEYEVRFDG